MLLELEGVTIRVNTCDRWILINDSSEFFFKSYHEVLVDKVFDHFTSVWIDLNLLKVNFLKCSITLGNLNTNDRIQLKLSKSHIFPNWCVLCKNNSEDIDPLFLHCPITLFL